MANLPRSGFESRHERGCLCSKGERFRYHAEIMTSAPIETIRIIVARARHFRQTNSDWFQAPRDISFIFFTTHTLTTMPRSGAEEEGGGGAIDFKLTFSSFFFLPRVNFDAAYSQDKWFVSLRRNSSGFWKDERRLGRYGAAARVTPDIYNKKCQILRGVLLFLLHLVRLCPLPLPWMLFIRHRCRFYLYISVDAPSSMWLMKGRVLLFLWTSSPLW